MSRVGRLKRTPPKPSWRPILGYAKDDEREIAQGPASLANINERRSKRERPSNTGTEVGSCWLWRRQRLLQAASRTNQYDLEPQRTLSNPANTWFPTVRCPPQKARSSSCALAPNNWAGFHL